MQNQNIKNIWFIGTGEFAALCLKNLYNEINFSKIITGMPTRSGRNGKENPSPVEIFAKNSGLEVTRTGILSKNENLLSEIPELIFVIDFGQIIREPFLNGPKFGCINIHPSMLPKFRGAAPIQRAIMNGDEKIGVSVFQLVEEMDAGPIFAQSEFNFTQKENASDIYKILSEKGSELAINLINSSEFEKKFEQKKYQDSSLITYAKKLEKNEFEISFNFNSDKIINSIRALDMSGGAFVKLKDGKRLKIWRAVKNNNLSGKIPGQILGLEKNNKNPVIACLDCSIELIEVQSEGRKKISGAEWLSGTRLKTGEII